MAETNNREQARLYAEAEQASALLRQRQRRIEELKRENEDLRCWADTLCLLTLSGWGTSDTTGGAALPSAVVRRVTPCRLIRQRRALTVIWNALLDETEVPLAVVWCRQRDMIIACQERNSEQNHNPCVTPSIKQCLYVRNNPDKLHLFVDNGSLVATGPAVVEYRYTLNAAIEDFSGDQNLLMARVFLWLRDKSSPMHQ